jgi:hypothetical protein
VSPYTSLAAIACRVGELLIQPQNMAAARRLAKTCLSDPNLSSVDAFQFPNNRDVSERNPPPENRVRLAPCQIVLALAALHDAHNTGVERVIANSPIRNKTRAKRKRIIGYSAILRRVKKLGDCAVPWFRLQLRRFKRILAEAKPAPTNGPPVLSAADVGLPAAAAGSAAAHRPLEHTGAIDSGAKATTAPVLSTGLARESQTGTRNQRQEKKPTGRPRLERRTDEKSKTKVLVYGRIESELEKTVDEQVIVDLLQSERDFTEMCRNQGIVIERKLIAAAKTHIRRQNSRRQNSGN